MQKVGILGSAVVGQTLAQGIKAHGYEVRIGSRTPAKLASFTESSGVPAGTLEAVGGWGELLVLAVQGTGAETALSLAGTASHRGKIVIDTTNPIAPDPPVDGVIQYFTGPNSSLLERLQAGRPCSFRSESAPYTICLQCAIGFAPPRSALQPVPSVSSSVGGSTEGCWRPGTQRSRWTVSD